MKKLLPLFFLFFIHFPFFAAEFKSTENLLQQLQKEKGKPRIETLLTLCRILENTQPEKAMQFGMEIILLPEDKDIREEKITALNILGNISAKENRLEQAKAYYNRALMLSEEITEKKSYHYTKLNIFLSGVQQQDENSSELITKAFGYFQSNANKSGQGIAMTCNAKYYQNIRDIPKAAEYYFKAIALMEHSDDKIALANALEQTGNFFIQIKAHEKAIDIYFKLFRAREFLDDKTGMTIALLTIANLHSRCNQLKTASEFGLRALYMAKSQGQKTLELDASMKLAEIYTRQNDNKRASQFISSYDETKAEINKEAKENLNATLEIEKKMLEKNRLMDMDIVREAQNSKIRTIGFILFIIVGFLVFSLYKKIALPEFFIHTCIIALALFIAEFVILLNAKAWPLHTGSIYFIALFTFLTAFILSYYIKRPTTIAAKKTILDF